MPGWVRRYERTWLRGDVLAGVTVTAYLVPQVMAYAELAGVPAQAGLWAAIGGPDPLRGPRVLAAAVGRSRVDDRADDGRRAGDDRRRRGPTAPAIAAALALLVAGFCVLGWLLRLGALADLLSRPVLVGYLAGIAAIMVASQLGKLLGVPEDGDGFLAELRQVLGRLDQVHGPTAVLSLVTLAAMLLAAAFAPRAPVALLGMLGATAAAALLDLSDDGVRLVGDDPRRRARARAPRRRHGRADRHAGTGARDRLRRLHRQHPHRPGVRLRGTTRPSTPSASCSRSARPTSAPGCCTGSRSAAAAAAPPSPTRSAGGPSSPGWSRSPAPLLALLTLQPAAGGVPARRARRGRRVRRHPAGRRARAGPVRQVPPQRAAAGAWPPPPACSCSTCCSASSSRSRSPCSTCCAGWRAPTTPSRGCVPGLAGMHDVDDYPSAEEIPGLLVYRYDSPLFFANAENFRTRALAAVDGREGPGALVPAQRRGQRRGRHHGRRRAGVASRRARPARASSSPWPASSRTCATSWPGPGCSTGSARTTSSPRCPPRWRATTTGSARSRPDAPSH